jgi:hypothetical protein
MELKHAEAAPNVEALTPATLAKHAAHATGPAATCLLSSMMMSSTASIPEFFISQICDTLELSLNF